MCCVACGVVVYGVVVYSVLVYLRDRLRDRLRDLLRLRVRPPDRLRERDFLRLADFRFLRAPPLVSGSAGGVMGISFIWSVSIFINQYVYFVYIKIYYFF